MGVNHGGSDVTVPKQFLDRPDIIVCLEQVTGKAEKGSSPLLTCFAVDDSKETLWPVPFA